MQRRLELRIQRWTKEETTGMLVSDADVLPDAQWTLLFRFLLPHLVRAHLQAYHTSQYVLPTPAAAAAAIVHALRFDCSKHASRSQLSLEC